MKAQMLSNASYFFTATPKNKPEMFGVPYQKGETNIARSMYTQ